jgi:DNA-directed RNA polymerase subunit L
MSKSKTTISSKSKSTTKTKTDSDSVIMSESITNSATLSDSSDEIQIRVIDHKPHNDTFNNYLVLGIKGKDIDNVIINTLRRVIMELLPIYAFDQKDIDITKNNSIYNNDYMRLRLSHFPVIGIKNDPKTTERSAELEYEANISTFEKKIEDLTEIEKREKKEKIEKSQNLIMSINVKNTSNDVLNVTTNNDFTNFYYETQPIQSPYAQDMLIIKLKPGEEFSCTATSSLNIGLKGANFMPVAVCVFAEPIDSNENSDRPNTFNTKPGEYAFNIESLKQLTEKEIIIRACQIIDDKLKNFLDVLTSKIIEYKSESNTDSYNLENKSPDDSSTESETITDSAIRNTSDDVLEAHRIKGIIKIENESHTFGNLLSRLLQNHNLIEFGGYKIDHLLIKELTIGYKTNGTDIVEVLNDIISKGRTIFAKIKTQTEALKIQ